MIFLNKSNINFEGRLKKWDLEIRLRLNRQQGLSSDWEYRDFFQGKPKSSLNLKGEY